MLVDKLKCCYLPGSTYYLFKKLSLGLTYGTPSGADAVQRVYVQAKYEF